MPYSTNGKNKMLDALAPTHASLHTADPGNTGANEVAGGAPAYARKAIATGAAAAGVKNATSQPVFDVPAGTTVTHVGYWDAIAGTFLGSDPVTNEAFAAQGQYTITAASFDLNA